MKLEFDVAVVGGGPAGMMAAASAAKLGARTVLLEKNAKLGRKLMITGKGRCNVCNQCDVQSFIGAIPGNGRFLYSAVNRFSPLDTMDYFEGLHVPLKTERGNRVFPVSDRAADIVDAMKEDVEASGVHVLQEDIKALIIKDGAVKGVKAASGKRIQSDSVIVACGGLSYPGTGSTGDGYRLARQAGHTIVPPRPSLVPLVCRENWCQELTRPFLAEYCGSGDRSETRKRNLPGFRRNAFYSLWRQRPGHIKRQRSYEGFVSGTV